MKRILAMILLCLLLCGCQTGKPVPAETQAPTQTETQPVPTQTRENPLLGTWVNGGTYENGSEYRETMTVNDDGTVIVIMEYQGEYYSTLTGTYLLSGNCFSVTIESEDEPYTTDYHYAVDGRQLTLTDNKGTYTYLRG